MISTLFPRVDVLRLGQPRSASQRRQARHHPENMTEYAASKRLVILMELLLQIFRSYGAREHARPACGVRRHAECVWEC